ncbi:SLAP domain-containing protein [Psychrobacillus sp. MER TA 171]|uniref:SLAP domain-containing protein n=1 Tax=Psychrobacillus sp. MER TA 171 TaxID=2939577 RepID=UPI00203C5171|nr:SLAP domain-containing protein [Psychrobacillus sp. MER TA 171]MCM3356535.1 SLAP domain-containing protein [Psychrobacillus sp. MER TA 171]
MFKPNQPKTSNRLKTILEFSDLWELDQQERYVFQYYHNKLKGLDPNQINIHGVALHKNDNGFIMTAIIRHSLQKTLNMEVIRLVVRDKDGKDIARKEFNMEVFGLLNSLRARPWIFEFDKDSLLVPEEEIKDKMEFEVLFEYQQPVVSDFTLQLDENWSNGLSPEQIASLEASLASMEAVEENSLSVNAFHFAEVEDGVHVYVVLRNGYKEEITISNLPVQLLDAAGDVVAKLGFPLEQFAVGSHQARPVSLHFPKNVFQKESPDFSSWNVQLTPQN